MKRFGMIGMALMAVLLCANFTSCSKEEDSANQGNEDVGGGEEVVVTKEKKLVKIVGSFGSDSETYEFSYDDKGRVTKASGVQNYDGEYENETVQFIWGDDAIMVDYKRSSSYSSENENYSAKLTHQNGLVQNSDTDEKFTYNGSGRISSRVARGCTTSVLWDGNKLVSISDEDGKTAFTYGSSSCKKGYFPFFPIMIGFDFELLYIANPELIGAKTTQLPTSYKYNSNHSKDEDEDSISLAYDFDSDGYITKVTLKQGGDTISYSLTWR